MADNVGYTPGTGATVAADEIAGVLHQRVKLGIGDDGVAVDVSATNPMPVSVGNFPATQPVSGSVSVSNLPASSSGATGAAVPADAEYIAFNDGGNLVGVSAANPLPVDIGAGGVVEVTDPAAELILTRMLNYLNSPMGYDKSLQRSRVTAVLESGTVTAVTTVATVTNMASIGGIQGQIGVYGQNLAAWANCVRARIT
jgi:hypothetical protein